MKTSFLVYLGLFFFASSLAYVNYAQYYVDATSGHLEGFQREILQGTGYAPFQYRILPHYAAEAVLSSFPKLTLRRVFGILDGIYIYLFVFFCSWFWKRENFWSVEENGSLSGPFVASLYYFIWNGIFHSGYTLLSLLYVVMSCVLLSYFLEKPGGVTLSLLIFTSVLQSFNRADVSFALGAGLLIYSVTESKDKAGIGTGFILIGISLFIQGFLSLCVFEHAKWPEEVGPFQLLNNFELKRIIPFIIFMFPYVGCVVFFFKEKIRIPGERAPVHYALFYASLVYLCLWLVLGKIDELRIFFPFSIPLSSFIVYAFSGKKRSARNSSC